jgi:hypothetical protein
MVNILSPRIDLIIVVFTKICQGIRNVNFCYDVSLSRKKASMMPSLWLTVPSNFFLRCYADVFSISL